MNAIILQEIQNQKELTILANTLNTLPKFTKRTDTPKDNDKIPVVLSSDNNYACFVATTGMSILYNTKSFIEFYILSDGITDENKELIRKSFESITPYFSLNFVECNANKVFSSIKLPDDYHVKLSTCNRLLVPMLIPKLKRAVYLDVDLIVLGDIKEIWDEKLDGHVFGCTPLYYHEATFVSNMKQNAQIAEDTPYWYFNSGVMLIDYDKWRKLKGGNEEIVTDLMSILSKINVNVTPDEVILNKFAYENGGYKVLPLKYNTHTDYSYNFLKKNKKILCATDKNILAEFEKLLELSNFDPELLIYKKPIIHHFFGKEKPWNCISSPSFPLSLCRHFRDFWFYAKNSMFFDEIEHMFIEKHMYIDYSRVKFISQYDVLKKYKMHLFLSYITFGKMRKRQIKSAQHYKQML